MEDRLIAAAIQNKENLSLVPPDFQFSNTADGVWWLLGDYYRTDPAAQSCDVEVLKTRLSSEFSTVEEISQAWNFLDKLPTKDLSVPNLLRDLREHKAIQLRQSLRNAATVGTDEELALAMQNYREFAAGDNAEIKNEDEMVLKSAKIKDLISKNFSDEGTIKLWPKKLNDITKGARRGHHIVVYARPEIGKTLFVLNLVAGFLHQGLRVLYVGNEDPATDILLRMICRLSKMTREHVIIEPDSAEAKAREVGYDNVVIASLAPGNFAQIQRLIDKEKPDVLVLDQLRNLDVNSEGRVQGLEKAATEARNMAKRNNLLCVSVTQAGESAEGKALLERSDIDSSKTGIPAQADLMVGIGADPQMEKTGFRTINLPKNKLSGVHSSFTFSIDPATGVILNA